MSLSPLEYLRHMRDEAEYLIYQYANAQQIFRHRHCHVLE